MASYSRWKDIRAEHVVRAGGEEAVKAGEEELLNEAIGHRLAGDIAEPYLGRQSFDDVT